jgi:class 3 adenylate cyclase
MFNRKPFELPKASYGLKGRAQRCPCVLSRLTRGNPRTRLDFTGIGPAVNMASRLETLTKQLGRTVLLSRAFADLVESDFDLERVGEHPVRGFNDPIELFAYHG